ncbi:MAG: aldo/keto reductase [Candidatus Nanopelagicales bacterium]
MGRPTTASSRSRTSGHRATGQTPTCWTSAPSEGIAYLPWSPLTGAELFAEHAAMRGVSPQRLTLAWLLGQSPVVIPIPGSTRPQTILDSIEAVQLSISVDEGAALSALPFQEQSLYPDSEPKPPL